MKVIYPVLFYEEKEDVYSVFVPDLAKALNTNASTCGNSLENAIHMAEDLIAGLILDEIQEGKKIPQASKIEEVTFEELERDLELEECDYISKFKTYVIVDISVFAEKWGKELVKNGKYS